MTLPMLWHRFGSIFTAQELLFFYLCCPTVVGTRAHAWGSKKVRAAGWAQMERHRGLGHSLSLRHSKGKNNRST